MAGAEVSEALRNLVRERAKGHCEYCLTSEVLSGIRCQIDHIIPRSRGGTTAAEISAWPVPPVTDVSMHGPTPSTLNQARRFPFLILGGNAGMHILLGVPMVQR